MTSVSAGHIILTPTQPVGSGRPQRESNPGPPHQESCALRGKGKDKEEGKKEERKKWKRKKRWGKRKDGDRESGEERREGEEVNREKRGVAKERIEEGGGKKKERG